MHIVLLPFGSAGDVFPFLWLGRQLQARGHRVTVVVACVFEEIVRKTGMDVIPMGTPEIFDRFISDPRVWQLFHGTKLVFEFAGESTEPIHEALENLVKNGRKPDLLMAPCTVFGARLFREKHGVPLITVHVQPAVLISAHETPVLFPGMQHFRKLPLRLRQWLVRLPNPADRWSAPPVREACARHGVPPPQSLWWDWAESPDGVLALFPEWFAKPQPDWPEPLYQWDFPLEDIATEHPLSPEVRAFLEAGEKPIVFTPGSANIQARRFFEVAHAAVTALNRRAIFVTRKLDQLPPHLPASILPVEYAPFSALIPHASVFVHHGGIGTLSQGFAAGVPQLLMAMAHDQPDNAHRLEQLGAGIGLTPRTFTPKRVEAALRRLLTEPGFQEAARHCQSRISHRRPEGDLIRWIESKL